MIKAKTSGRSFLHVITPLFKIGIFALVAVAVFQNDEIRKDVSSSISSLSSVTATLLGFIIAAGAALIAVIEKPFLRNLNKTGHLDKVWHMIMMSGALMLGSLITSIFCPVLPGKYQIFAISISYACLSASLVETVSACSRLMIIFRRI